MNTKLLGIIALFTMLLGVVGATNSTTYNMTVNATQANVLVLQRTVANQSILITTLVDKLNNDTNTIVLLKLNLSDNYQSIYPAINTLSQTEINKTYLANFTSRMNLSYIGLRDNTSLEINSIETNTISKINQSLVKANASFAGYANTLNSWNQGFNLRINNLSNTVATNNGIQSSAIATVANNSNNSSGDALIIGIIAIVFSLGAVGLVLFRGRQ